VSIAVVRLVVLPIAGLLVALIVARQFDAGWWQRRIDPRAQRLVAGAALLSALVFGGLLAARYATWHSFVFDLGSYDQKIWLASTRPDLASVLEQTYRGGVRVSPCGTARYWGICHFQPLYVGYALLYRLWPSPLALLGLQALLVASGAVPCYLLGVARLGSPAAGVLGAALYLLHPAVQFNALLDFRPDHVAIPFLLWAFWLVDRKREIPATAAAAVPALAKESLLLSFAMFGLYLAARRRRVALGLAVCVAGAGVFYVVAFHLLSAPGRSEGSFMIGRYLSGQAALLSPGLAARKLVYIGTLFGPVGFLPLLAPLALLPAIPSLAVSLLSNDIALASIHSQYSAAVVGPLFAALFGALARLARRPGTRLEPTRTLAGLVVLSAAFSVALGPTPLSLNFWNARWGGHWHYRQYLPDRQAALDEAESVIPADPDVMVVTQNDVNSARLAHRHFYFAFPNGLERADYVLLDERRLPFVYWVPDAALYERVERRLRNDLAYRRVFERDGIVVFARGGERNPGPPDLGGAPAPPGSMPR